MGAAGFHQQGIALLNRRFLAIAHRDALSVPHVEEFVRGGVFIWWCRAALGEDLDEEDVFDLVALFVEQQDKIVGVGAGYTERTGGFGVLQTKALHLKISFIIAAARITPCDRPWSAQGVG